MSQLECGSARLRHRSAPALPSRDLDKQCLINKQYVTPLLVRGRRSYFFETIANAVKRLDHIEVNVARPELLAQSLDVAVDRPVVHIALFAIGYIHQGFCRINHF